MNIDIRSKNIVLNNNIRSHIKRRLGFAFDNKQDQILAINVILTDVNGPKGGVDKKCVMLIRLDSCKEVVVKEQREGIRSAVDMCAHRASKVVSRKLMKNQQKRAGLEAHHKYQMYDINEQEHEYEELATY